MRVGLLTKKIGMTRIFDETGTHQAVTVLECPESIVLNSNHNAKNRVKLASFDVKERLLNKPQIAEFKKLKSSAKKHIVEFQVNDATQYKVGNVITVEHFVEGQYIDARGRNIGKGFAGAMKRHGFGGLEASHGISVSHRSHGSTGQCQDPGKVFKGKKMAGQMGNVNVTVQNLEIIKIDAEQELIFVKGAVPGKPGAIIKITDAVKKHLPSSAPLPAFFKQKVANAKQENKIEDNKDNNKKAENLKAEDSKGDVAKDADPSPVDDNTENTVDNISQVKDSNKKGEEK